MLTEGAFHLFLSSSVDDGYSLQSQTLNQKKKTLYKKNVKWEVAEVSIKLWSRTAECAKTFLYFPGKGIKCPDTLDERIYSLTFHMKIGIVTFCFPAVFHLTLHRLCGFRGSMSLEMRDETTSPSYFALPGCPEYRKCWSIVINSCPLMWVEFKQMYFV